MADGDGFLDRWSRRKLAARQPESAADIDAAPEEPTAPEAEEGGAEIAGEPHLAETIDIDTLTSDSDFTVFMERGVPADIRRKALRKLWASDPTYAKVDRLNDFFDVEDTRTWGLGEIRKTAWKLGRGFQSEDEIAPPPRRHDAPEPEDAEEEVVALAEEPDETAADEDAADKAPATDEAPTKLADAPGGTPDEDGRS